MKLTEVGMCERLAWENVGYVCVLRPMKNCFSFKRLHAVSLPHNQNQLTVRFEGYRLQPGCLA